MASYLDALQKAKDDKEAYKAGKQEERSSLGRMADEGIMAITSDTNYYLTYLHKQALNPTMSITNLAVVMQQRPEATVTKSFDGWKAVGRSIKAGEKGIMVFGRQEYIIKDAVEQIAPTTGEIVTAVVESKATGYGVNKVFDISQTTGKVLPPLPVLKEKGAELTAGLMALIKSCPVEIVEVTNSEKGVLYDPQAMRIEITKGLKDSEVFYGLARESYLAGAHVEHGVAFDRNYSYIDAVSVAYITCKRYSVDVKTPNFSGIPEMYRDVSLEGRQKSLEPIQKAVYHMCNALDRELVPNRDKQQVQQPMRNIPVPESEIAGR